MLLRRSQVFCLAGAPRARNLYQRLPTLSTPIRATFGRRKLVYTNTSGAATATDEYVPTMIPITMAKAKLLINSPPNTNNANTVRNVKPEVRIVRLRV